MASANRHAWRRCSAINSGAASGVPLNSLLRMSATPECNRCRSLPSSVLYTASQIMACLNRARSCKLKSGSAKTPSRASTSNVWANSDSATLGISFSSKRRGNSRPRTDADCTIGANCGQRPRRDSTTSCNGVGTSSPKSACLLSPSRVVRVTCSRMSGTPSHRSTILRTVSSGSSTSFATDRTRSAAVDRSNGCSAIVVKVDRSRGGSPDVGLIVTIISTRSRPILWRTRAITFAVVSSTQCRSSHTTTSGRWIATPLTRRETIETV